jgi:hypothetical protein
MNATQRDVTRPAFGGVERDDADGVAVLTCQQVADQRGAVGLNASLVPGFSLPPAGSTQCNLIAI